MDFFPKITNETFFQYVHHDTVCSYFSTQLEKKYVMLDELYKLYQLK